MMRKVISMSALVAGLMGTPLMAAMPAKGREEGPQTWALCAETEPAERMQALHLRMAQDVQDHLAEAIALARRGPFLFESPATRLHVEFVENIGPWPGAGETGPGVLMAAPVQTEKAAYLGVATVPVSPALQDQLKLPRGMGLLVEYVEKDSPADKAGLQKHDVLEKLDDQLLVDAQQFAVLVRSKKPGDHVTIGIIRQGEHRRITATLGEKELPALEDESNRLVPMAPGGVMPTTIPGDLGEAWQHSVRRTVTGHADGSITRRLQDRHNEITLNTTRDGVSSVKIEDRHGHELYAGPYTTDEEKARVPAEYAEKVKSLSLTGRILPGEIGTNSTATISRFDADQQITMKINAAGKSLLVKDTRTGKVIYDGPANSPEDLKSLPPEIVAKVKSLETKVKLGK